jgi:hypothetical protein
MNDKRIYISGKITGLEYGEAQTKFNRVEMFLSACGWQDTANPMQCKSIKEGDSWEFAMGECLKILLRCDAIYMLSDWQQSRGARVEHVVAKELGIEIIYQ